MNSIDSTYAKLSEQCYDFHADVGLFFVIVFPVLNLEIQKFGPKNPGSFWLFFFFRMPSPRLASSVAWIRSSFSMKQKVWALRTVTPWQDSTCFFLKTHLNLPSKQFLFEILCMFFFQSKIRQTKIKCLINFPIKNKWFLLKQSKIRCLPFMFMPWFLFPWKKYLENFFFWSHFP